MESIKRIVRRQKADNRDCPAPPAAPNDVMDYPEPEIVLPKGPHTHTAIILHGRGDTGRNFGAMLLMVQTSTHQTLQDALPGFKFVFPSAKRRPAAGAGGLVTSQWFDIWSLKDQDKRAELQYEGIRESTEYVQRVIDREAAVIGLEKVVLGGLSQGMALGLHVLISYIPRGQTPADTTNSDEIGTLPHLPAFFGMSGWLPFANTYRHPELWHQNQIWGGEQSAPSNDAETNASRNPNTSAVSNSSVTESALHPSKAFALAREIAALPTRSIQSGQTPPFIHTSVFLGHGLLDHKVMPELGEEARDILVALGCNVRWHSYPDLGHWYKVPDELDDIIDFLQDIWDT